MKSVSLALLVAIAPFASACVMVAPVVPPPAVIQTYQAPLDIDHHDTPRASKHGRATTHNVLGLVSWGDASTRAAALNGGIERIESADYEFFSVLVYSSYTTIVHGE